MLAVSEVPLDALDPYESPDATDRVSKSCFESLAIVSAPSSARYRAEAWLADVPTDLWLLRLLWRRRLASRRDRRLANAWSALWAYDAYVRPERADAEYEYAEARDRVLYTLRRLRERARDLRERLE